MPKIKTTTISLPSNLYERAKHLAQDENRSLSSLFREGLKLYERTHNGIPLSALASKPKKERSWDQLQASLKRIGRAGKGGNLSQFVIADRQRH